MLTTILLLLGMGFISSQATAYAGNKQAALASQARQLALAGLEDARVKLELDIDFPPPPGPGQALFSYSELLPLPTSPPNNQGSYLVIVDSSEASTGAKEYRLTAVGSVGPPREPIAQYRIEAAIDNDSSHPQPKFFHYKRFVDEEMP